ncbi:nucleotidyl transferase AbiEii/AbiGii toxin family protein [Nocardia uniformis]|uniref:nucleotidyl transferase AbiEii/AbiGii toxin family protein n=1 Tax=Nocardia uniformis TaxID=53432 RepID=UPI001C3FB0EC|nr:nucleotidyl transferase AbiEii/AbiGii toxin family protein [Nocardia uniformis]
MRDSLSPAATRCEPTAWATAPSGDLDLFTDWHRRADFPGAVDAVVAELELHGYDVTAAMSNETFARLLVLSADGGPDKLEMSADWRAHPPVLLEIGPVLHPDDAVANKMCALFGRALPRDFLDIDAAFTSGRYGHDRLLELAKNADDGFEPRMFADALGALTQITDDAFAEYGVPPEDVDAMRKRFADWRRELLATS